MKVTDALVDNELELDTQLLLAHEKWESDDQRKFADAPELFGTDLSPYYGKRISHNRLVCIIANRRNLDEDYYPRTVGSYEAGRSRFGHRPVEVWCNTLLLERGWIQSEIDDYLDGTGILYVDGMDLSGTTLFDPVLVIKIEKIHAELADRVSFVKTQFAEWERGKKKKLRHVKNAIYRRQQEILLDKRLYDLTEFAGTAPNLAAYYGKEISSDLLVRVGYYRWRNGVFNSPLMNRACFAGFTQEALLLRGWDKEDITIKLSNFGVKVLDRRKSCILHGLTIYDPILVSEIEAQNEKLIERLTFESTSLRRYYGQEVEWQELGLVLGNRGLAGINYKHHSRIAEWHFPQLWYREFLLDRGWLEAEIKHLLMPFAVRKFEFGDRKRKRFIRFDPKLILDLENSEIKMNTDLGVRLFMAKLVS